MESTQIYLIGLYNFHILNAEFITNNSLVTIAY